MAFTYVDDGNIINQEAMLNKTSPADYTMILYTARNPNPVSLAGFTEATAAGYTEQEMTGANWIIDANSATYPQVAFIFTDAETVVGYVIKRGTTLVGYEDFSDGPYVIGAGGGTIGVNFTQNYTA